MNRLSRRHAEIRQRLHDRMSASVSDLAEAEFAATVLSRGERCVVVTDHSKFGRNALVNVCGFEVLDCLVTDAQPPDDLARSLAAANVAVEIAATPL